MDASCILLPLRGRAWSVRDNILRALTMTTRLGNGHILVVVVVVIFFQYNESIDIVDELVLNKNSMIHRLMMIL